MERIQSLKAWRFLSLLILLFGGASLSYAQWVDTGGAVYTLDDVAIGTTGPTSLLDVRLNTDSNNEIAKFINTGATSERRRTYIDMGTDNGNNLSARWTYVHSATVGNRYMTFNMFGESLGTGLVVRQGGNVGIGTTGPSSLFDVRLNTDSSEEIAKFINTGATTEGRRIYIDLGTDNGNNLSARWTYVHSATVGNRYMTFNMFGESLGTGLVVRQGGNVGIGTTSPSSKLHVAGDAVIDGNIAAKYQDVAEWVPATTSLAPGTVVVIDALKGNRVVPSSRAYDTRIAGVVSSQPGIILGEAGEDKVKVAYSGRVKVKADAQFGPISVGDLLVSSGSAGYAMRSVPVDISGVSMHRPGTIVGKALEPLKEGQGEILALLTLQ